MFRNCVISWVSSLIVVSFVSHHEICLREMNERQRFRLASEDSVGPVPLLYILIVYNIS